MSFEDEWTQLKADAARDPVRMQLNGHPGPPSTGSSPPGDLQVNQKDLAAIGDAAFRLHQDLDRDGDHARLSTYLAATSLRNDFLLGAALEHVTARWKAQQDSLLGACAHISNHLDWTEKAHAGQETYLVTEFSRISDLSQGFDERSRPR